MHRLDPKTGEIKVFPYPEARPMRFYGIEADSRGNLYGASLQLAMIGELNGETGEWNLYPTPTPDSGSRRGDIDSQDRFWFAEYYVGKIGMFDTRTKQFKEWDIPPTPWSGPYDVVVDKNGEVWASGRVHGQSVSAQPGYRRSHHLSGVFETLYAGATSRRGQLHESGYRLAGREPSGQNRESGASGLAGALRAKRRTGFPWQLPCGYWE